MRNPARIPKILKELKRVWEASPDLRLGQLLNAAGSFSSSMVDVPLLEDDDLLEGLRAIESRQPKAKRK